MKIKSFVKLSTLGALLAFGTSSLLMLSSCASVNSIHPRIIDYSCIFGSNKDTPYLELASTKTSMTNIINGDKSLNHGNYVIFVGTTGGFDDNQPDGKNTSKSLWGSENGWNPETSNWSNGIFSLAIEYLNEINNPESKDPVISDGITFLCYLDLPPVDAETSYSPIDKWTAEDEENYEHVDGIDAVEGEYKRKDRSAEEFRMLIDLITTLYGSSYCDSIPFIIPYVEGKANTPISATTSSAFLTQIQDLYDINPLNPDNPEE